MAIFRCKMCGGDLDVTEGISVIECEYCGSKQTVPSADNEKKVTLFGRANRLLLACEFDKAAGVFESIVSEFPEEAEAYWGLILCKYGIEYVDDPATGKKIPTCHRSSFDSVMEDGDFEQVMENADVVARTLYREEAKKIEELRKGIIEISAKEEPYDIFICYKETAPDGNRTIDSVIAQDVYTALTEKGYRIFFSRISLEGKLGVAYEPYIFAALNSAKIMLAFGTDYEYYNAVWVKNEWSRFLQLIAKGEKKTLIPCYKNIDAYDMPKEFAKLQAQDMGKVGAIQDLLRGIEKILPKNKDTVQTFVAQQTSATSLTEPLLKRVFMFLEDAKWKEADEYCEKVLDIDPECADAYLGKLMAAVEVRYKANLANCANYEKIITNPNYQKALRFADEKLKQELHMLTASYMTKLFEAPEVCQKNDDGTVTIIGLPDKLKESERVVLPNRVYNLPVVEISHLGYGHVKEVIIPQGVERIGENAFSSQMNLTSVTIPDGVTSIGAEAFLRRKNLASINIPQTVSFIGERAFAFCQSLTAINVDKDNVTYTSVDGNLYNKSLTTLIAVASGKAGAFQPPESVRKIEAFAFHGTALETIHIHKSVEQLDNSSIGVAEQLSAIVVDSDNPFYEVIDGILYTKDRTVLLRYLPFKKETHFDISNQVSTIGDYAFCSCRNLTSVSIPDSVTAIGRNSFAACTNLASITIPQNVSSIGDGAFSGCESLTSIAIPENVSSINNRAFSGCKSLTSITIPESVTAIGNWAFWGCTGLTSITIPESVTAIGNSAFSGCTGLTSITIPESVTAIGNSAFSGCTGLTAITIPESVTAIGDWAFFNCTGLKSVTILGDVKSIGRSVFSGSEIINNVVLFNTESASKYDFPIFSKIQSLQELKKREEEKQRREAEFAAELAEKKKLEQLLRSRRAQGVCQHCGGQFKGLFSKTCVACGKKKDY